MGQPPLRIGGDHFNGIKRAVGCPSNYGGATVPGSEQEYIVVIGLFTLMPTKFNACK